MGNYKYLMLTFSTFGIIFAIIDGSNQPMLHFYDGAYIIFSRNVLCLPRKLSFWYIALNCSCYGMIMLLLVFHFMYRYLAVCKPHRLELFSFPYFNILIGIFVVISLEWWITANYVAGENVVVEEHIRETMLKNYGLSRLDYTYASSLFYRTDPATGIVSPSLPDFLYLVNLGIIILSGLSVILFCWLKLRSELIHSARQLQSISQKTLEMQRQLFRALVAQTLLPIFLMFIPAGILLCFPILRTDMGPIEVIILPIITTQPFMDAIVPMYYIKDYRKAVLKCVRKTKRSVRIHQASSQIDERSRTSRVFSLRT
uniref:Seven TM Receptor n=1 Tax=Caenorhabditis tropicalis TaxID=1561998 RepID=A0A1I7V2X7_9PELO